MKQSSSSKKLIVSCDKGSTKPRNTITIHTVPSNLSTLITARNRSWRYWQQTTVGPVWNSYNEMLKPLSRNRDTGNQSRHPRTCPVGGGGGGGDSNNHKYVFQDFPFEIQELFGIQLRGQGWGALPIQSTIPSDPKHRTRRRHRARYLPPWTSEELEMKLPRTWARRNDQIRTPLCRKWHINVHIRVQQYPRTQQILKYMEVCLN